MIANEIRPSCPLTRRQHEIVQALASGMTNHQMAERFNVVLATIDQHINEAGQRLSIPKGTGNKRVLIIKAALRHGCLTIQELED